MEDYHCSKCGISGVKLWRSYASSHIDLLCVNCTEKEQERPCQLPETDQIGWRIPAVPNGEGSYWGYSSVPDEWVQWWKSLPTRPLSALDVIAKLRAENKRLKADAITLRTERDKLKVLIARHLSNGDYDNDPEWWQLVALQAADIIDTGPRDPKEDLF